MWCACLPCEGSLKQHTDTPLVLDRFKKWFLYGITGKLFLNIEQSAITKSSGWSMFSKEGIAELMMGLFAILMVHLLTIVKFLHEGYEPIRERFAGFLFSDKFFIDYHLINPSIIKAPIVNPHSAVSS